MKYTHTDTHHYQYNNKKNDGNNNSNANNNDYEIKDESNIIANNMKIKRNER